MGTAPTALLLSTHGKRTKKKEAWLPRGYYYCIGASEESAYRSIIIRRTGAIADTLLASPNSINAPELLVQGWDRYAGSWALFIRSARRF